MNSETMLPKPFVFVLMPFDSSFDDIYKFGIKGAADDVEAYAERVDEQLFGEGILDRIFNQISKSDVVVADMSGRNPNVFYEVGYAHALGKIVILLTQSSDDIPFDLKHRQHTVYGGRIETLRAELAPRIQWALGEAKRRQSAAPREHFSLQLNGVPLAVGVSEEEPPSLGGSVAERTFSLPLRLRNDGVGTLYSISHLYLFAPHDAPAQPCDWKPVGGGGHGWVPLRAFKATDIDAPDGLSQQYRLPIKFATMPPGAMEEASVGMSLIEGTSRCDAIYRLRIHSDKLYHDYRFRLKIALKEPVIEQVPAQSPSVTTSSGSKRRRMVSSAPSSVRKRKKTPA